MGIYAMDLCDVDGTALSRVGGKASKLGELLKLGLCVPGGFCVTTEAFERALGTAPVLREHLEGLALLGAEDRGAIARCSGEIRDLIADLSMPRDIEEELTRLLAGREGLAYAVRSSAAAEDLPTASFAGQLESYLNVTGTEALLEHIRKCWASSFRERAIAYRLERGFDPGKVSMAVLLQELVPAQVSGVLFSADPVSCHRKVASIDAAFGLGEALVSGRMNADTYKVREGRIIEKRLSTKSWAVVPSPEGGTMKQEIGTEHQARQALTDGQILELEALGRKIEAHFGCPQDIEWCLADGAFSIVQSRPITTLFPIPEPHGEGYRVYISVGHQQMMTDAIKPLGISVWQHSAGRPMHEAGGRLFVEVAPLLADPDKQAALLASLGQSDPLLEDALRTLIGREDAFPLQEAPKASANPGSLADSIDPAVIPELIQRDRASVEELRQKLEGASGLELLDLLLEDLQGLKKSLFAPQSFGVILAALKASAWINEKMEEWLGEQSAADDLSRSVPNNVTSEMGLALLDVADVIRPFPEVVELLDAASRQRDDGFLERLELQSGGKEARDALLAFLDDYGMRCPGEIDITTARWSEAPSALLPALLSNIKNHGPGASARRFEQGQQKASQRERDLLERLRALPHGEERAQETQGMIRLLRSSIGYREYPKYGMVCRYFLYKQALRKEAEQLVHDGVLREVADIDYLSLRELRELLDTRQGDEPRIRARREAHKLHQKLTPPRVLTSDGEVVAGQYRREALPPGALVGLPVCTGVVEGRARIVASMQEADLEAGDILVTCFTDPCWTPLFLSIQGLVTEVGGLMTHGAVIAREYGLPAIVGVKDATTQIRDGQRIRLHGTAGYIEILD